jgi:Holliday junction resolvase RusA-like endonuclease
MPSTTFIVAGSPVPKGRARSIPTGGAGDRHFTGIAHVTPANTRRWETEVQRTAKRAHGSRALFKGALRVTMEFRMPIPQSWAEGKKAAAASGMIYHTQKPDLDNLEKSIKDACNKIVWTDDAIVVDLKAHKEYSYDPCAIVTVETLDTLEDGE